ncbi:uncharacterized protein TRIADDRAFT_60926 [Trichoplax adhaerens]|uniref:MAM domain-containing protein n=1 Tax=Trichoplax adhaerens TaxID=10228 RepID=B3S9J0_TRIAD|nr:predicted protein [Trichoplax adhaerens]EDV20709.1 predicted protein [Trichoplax adhaerens]|eukprot:XP_002116909.1 predicted protein [Trichoplax adhaerens]
MGAAPEKIVFANPCKPISHINKQDKVDRCPISNPVTFHKCEFMKGECGWKQLRAVDFTDWERDAKIGMVLNSKYENINGQYANMIIPPMVQISFGYNGSYTGNLYVMVMYPKYSDKLKVIDTINPQSALLGPLTITRYQIFFSPLYTDYQHSGRLNANTLTPNKIWRNNRTTIYFKTKMERSINRTTAQILSFKYY